MEKMLQKMHLFEQMDAYKKGQNESKSLVRFKYDDQESMFDLVSYNKGGVILHMLRKYLGDDAFFTGLKKLFNKIQVQKCRSTPIAFGF